jgi:hypothetical protein
MKMLVKLVTALFQMGGAGSRSGAVKRRPLRLECLEGRDAPAANLLWIGNAGAAWSVKTNWGDLDSGNIAAAAPTSGDNLDFQSGRVTINFTGTDATSTDDINNVTFGSVNVLNAGATNQTITLNAPLKTANAAFTSGLLEISGAGANSVTVDPGNNAGSVSIIGMKFSTNLTLKANVTTTLGGGAASAFNGNVDNYGTVTWAASDLSLTGTLTNYAGATFTIQSDNTLSDGNPRGQGPASFVNQGTLQKTIGAVNFQTLIGMALTTSGTLFEQAGKLTFSGAITQNGAASKTIIAASTLATSTTFTLNAGTLYGGGTLSGNLTSSGTVDLGNQDNTLTGVLTVTGNYTQNAGGTLYATFDANGGIPELIVGGTATLNGTLTVHRVPGYALPANDYFVIAAAAVAGNFTTTGSDPQGDAWAAGGANVSFTGFAVVGARYRVTVS